MCVRLCALRLLSLPGEAGVFDSLGSYRARFSLDDTEEAALAVCVHPSREDLGRGKKFGSLLGGSRGILECESSRPLGRWRDSWRKKVSVHTHVHTHGHAQAVGPRGGGGGEGSSLLARQVMCVWLPSAKKQTQLFFFRARDFRCPFLSHTASLFNSYSSLSRSLRTPAFFVVFKWGCAHSSLSPPSCHPSPHHEDSRASSVLSPAPRCFLVVKDVMMCCLFLAGC